LVETPSVLTYHWFGMLVVGIDTSESRGSVALLDGSGLAVERPFVEPLRHAELLLPTLDGVFKETGRTTSDVSVVCVNLGPGSFTGLRIGLAAAKGFCQALGVPLRGVEGTLAYRSQVAAEGRVCVAVASRRDMVYARWYVGMRPSTAAMSMRESELIERLCTDARPTTVVGSAAQRVVEALGSRGSATLGRTALWPSALAVARAGLGARDGRLCEMEPHYTEPLLGSAAR